MARKKDELSKRLANAITVSKKPGGFHAYLWPHVRKNKPPRSEPFKGITIPARGSFRWEFAWRPVHDAFKAFGLDPSKPEHWEQLVHHLAAVHFGRDAGAPKYWTSSRLCRLAVDYANLKAANPGKSEPALCKLLAAGGRYSNPARARVKDNALDPGSGIRRVLPQARRELAGIVAEYKACAPPAYAKKIEAWITKTYTNFSGELTEPYFDLPIDSMRYDLGLPDD
jgi:hypothetical protein